MVKPLAGVGGTSTGALNLPATRSLRPVGRALSDFINELAYNAKLHKPDNRWVTSEWDRVVDLVAEAMKAKRDEVPRG